MYNIYVNNKTLDNMEQTTEKFMNALIQVAKLLYPNLVIESKRTERTEHKGGVDMTYEINGHDEETMLNVTILSRGFVLGGKGAQIEIVENGVTRYFPFFGFNWTYLMA